MDQYDELAAMGDEERQFAELEAAAQVDHEAEKAMQQADFERQVKLAEERVRYIAELAAGARKIQIDAKNFPFLSRRVRRKFERAYMKMHGVPKPVHERVSRARVFKMLNRVTMLEMLATDLDAEKPKMNLLGQELP